MKKNRPNNKNNLILISVSSPYIRIAQLKEGILSDFHLENFSTPSQVGAIYKAQVAKKQAALEACFVNLNKNTSGFLYMGNKKPDQKNQKENTEVLTGSHLEKTNITLNEEPESNNRLQALKTGQMLMVQVVKDPLKGKSFRVSDRISLPGTYLVYLPNSPFHIGISRQIEKEEIKKKLMHFVQKWCGTEALIIRTKAEKASEEELKRDFESLKKTWGDILEKYQSQKKPGLIWSDGSLSFQILRDTLTEEVEQVLVDDKTAFVKIKDFVSKEMPKEKHKISLYKSKDYTVFDHYNLEVKLNNLLSKKVQLDSGGVIVIEETEAAVVVDVNTGRFMGKKEPEENILKINKEAAKEIATQLRLRNCGGIIIIDFIDMEMESSRSQLMEFLTDELNKDRTPTRLLPMSEFGIVQLTRKRNRASLLEKLSSPCPQCGSHSFLKKI